MEQVVMAVIFFIIALFSRRRAAFRFTWQPTSSTWVAIGTAGLASVFSAAMLLFEPGSVAPHLIHYGLIYVVCGVALPWGYTLLVEHAGPAELGLRREKWLVSLVVGFALAALLSLVIVFEADLSAVRWGQLGQAAVSLVGAGGLFELFLYYGFVHLRMEKAFGIIPAILFTAALYVLWHIGTQLPLEADVTAALLKLFAVGVMYQSVFSLTRNVLIIWPFFHGVGVMIDFMVNLGELERASQSFPWAVGALVLMSSVGAVLAWRARYRRRPG